MHTILFERQCQQKLGSTICRQRKGRGVTQMWDSLHFHNAMQSNAQTHKIKIIMIYETSLFISLPPFLCNFNVNWRLVVVVVHSNGFHILIYLLSYCDSDVYECSAVILFGTRALGRHIYCSFICIYYVCVCIR